MFSNESPIPAPHRGCATTTNRAWQADRVCIISSESERFKSDLNITSSQVYIWCKKSWTNNFHKSANQFGVMWLSTQLLKFNSFHIYLLPSGNTWYFHQVERELCRLWLNFTNKDGSGADDIRWPVGDGAMETIKVVRWEPAVPH